MRPIKKELQEMRDRPSPWVLESETEDGWKVWRHRRQNRRVFAGPDGDTTSVPIK